MNAPNTPPQSRWRLLPWCLLVLGLLGIGLGLDGSDLMQLGSSWLVAFMFFLSVALGALFLVMMHHLFDAAWSAPLRRLMENLACLSFPPLLIFFFPIAFLAKRIYPQLNSVPFVVISVLCLAGWAWLAHRLRYWSLEQDRTGAVLCTQKMRFHSAWGILFYGLSITVASSLWIKALNGPWFSTIYGLWYFTGSVWMAVAVIYFAAVVLQRSGALAGVLREEQYYFLGSLLLGFTLLYGYVCYCQYFIIWNGNLPGETKWYVIREQGGWRSVGYLLLFGHVILPFLMLLRADWKTKSSIMLPLCLWACLMHFLDLQFQIMPVLHPRGWSAARLCLDAGCLLFFSGVISISFVKSMRKHHPTYPLRDPRLAEALGIHTPPTTDIATAPERLK